MYVCENVTCSIALLGLSKMTCGSAQKMSAICSVNKTFYISMSLIEVLYKRGSNVTLLFQ